jgi:hypothetical protein
MPPQIRRSVPLAIMLGAAVIADGYFQPAVAQCAAGTQIFIDPRLAPQRPQISQAQLARILGSAWISSEVKETMYNQYMMQYQPVEVPFRGGKVLINPSDPCIQQYIGQ